MKTLLASILALGLSACASYDGRGLVPGQSTAADVETLMGAPTERIAQANGDTLLFYSRLPFGRRMYAATIGSDGRLRGMDQRLTYQSIAKLVPNTSSAKEVRELLGPPYRAVRMNLQERDVWEYPWQNYDDRRILWVQFSYDGVVREVIELHDLESDSPSGPGTGGKD
jgi:hypothetical protein